MYNFKVAHSELKDAAEAVKSIHEQLADVDARMVLYFVSTAYPVETVCREMADAFKGVQTVGCTTAGEMITGKMGQNSIVAMAWHKNALEEVYVEALENIKTDDDAVEKAFKSFENKLGMPMKEADHEKYVGIVLIDGLSGCEEKLNDRLGNHTNVPFVGGSAGDDGKFECTYVFANGKTYTNAAVLALLKPANGYMILKSHSFMFTDKKFVPTKVDESRRMVMEFDGKPAAEVYARAMGVPKDAVTGYEMSKHPVGLVFEGADGVHYFVRSPYGFDGNAITFYCSVKEGLELTMLQACNIVEHTREDLRKCGKIQAAVDFNCMYRTNELRRKNELTEYSQIFDCPAIGFATYGESYIGHMNQTSTMLLLK